MGDIRSVFISDTHLGCKHIDHEGLYKFLKDIPRPEYLYLVGDIIDGWRLRRSWNWHDRYNHIIRKILGFSKKGTHVIYTPGNHDEFMRDYFHEFGDIEVVDEIIHETVDGRKLLVLHGDKFDNLLRCGKFVNWMGDFGYNLLMWSNRYINFFRRLFGCKRHWSLSQRVKASVKSVSSYVSNFEDLLSKYTKERECDGVVCGHIHTPKITEFQGISYYNCGDWVESSTALVERKSGEIELIYTK